jgi:outer membrane protein assembly factor BamD
MRKYILIIVGLVVLSATFSSEAEWKSKRKRRYDCSKDLVRAIEKYNKGHYNETKTILAETKYPCTGHSAMDSILYYLGMSSLFSKAREDARAEFDRLVIDFPNSSFSEEARFRIGHCSFLASNPPSRDQSRTRDAIRELKDFVNQYPNSVFADSATAYLAKCHDKLAQKEFDAARFYQKLEKYESAIVYYRTVETDFPLSAYVYESRISTAYCLAKLKRPAEGKLVLEKLIGEKPVDEVLKKAESLMGRLDIIANEKQRFGFLHQKVKPASDTANTEKQQEQSGSGASEPEKTGAGVSPVNGAVAEPASGSQQEKDKPVESQEGGNSAEQYIQDEPGDSISVQDSTIVPGPSGQPDETEKNR